MSTMTAERASDQVDFGRALELMGQLPTLACRAAVNALMAASTAGSTADREAKGAQFRKDLDGLSTLIAALKQGDSDLGVSRKVAEALERSVWSDPEIASAIDGFVSSAFFLSVQLSGPAAADQAEARRLGDMAAGSVVTACERATALVRRLFDEMTAEDRRRVGEARDLTVTTLEKLDDLTLRIQLISVNASIEAARAGRAGAGFGVIAQEINMLSLGAQDALKEIGAGFQRLA